jgi:hypothetical protein
MLPPGFSGVGIQRHDDLCIVPPIHRRERAALHEHR